jgi:hypothetical protein
MKLNRTNYFTGVSFILLGLSPATISSFGAAINYGNFGPVAPGLQFLGVTESSGTDTVPLFGPPSSFATGLDFDPVGFTSSSTAGVPDITDGQLNLTIRSSPDIGLATISLFEAGDYTLAGVGTPATSVFAGGILHLTITELNGVDVAPIHLPPVNASVAFSLPGGQVLQPWSLGLAANIQSLLAPGDLATEVEVVLDNVLVSLSQAQTVGFISKKEFQLNVETTTGTLRTFSVHVPETGSTGWLTAGGIGVALLGRRWMMKCRP